MNEESNVSFQDDVLADPIVSESAVTADVSELADELAAAETELATPVFHSDYQLADPVLPIEEPTQPIVEKRSEVAKILLVVAVGSIGGILGGITLAKYTIGGPKAAARPVHVVAAKVPIKAAPSAPLTAQATAQPAVQAPPVSTVNQQPTQNVAQAKSPELVAASAVKSSPVATPISQAPVPPSLQVLGIYAQQKDAATDVIVFLSAPAEIKPEKLANPNRLFFDVPNAAVTPSALHQVAHLNNPILQRVRAGRSADGATRLVMDMKSGFSYKYALSKEAPYRLTITLQAE